MNSTALSIRRVQSPLKIAVSLAVLLLALGLGYKASIFWPVLLVAGMGAAVLLRWPILSLVVLMVACLAVPIELATGTSVNLNTAMVLIPATAVLWLLSTASQRESRVVSSRVNRPLLLFLLAGLLSLLVGNALWDPSVPRPSGFTVVQVAQWAIFALSAAAFWLMGNLVRDEAWLRRLTFTYLAVAGGLAIPFVLPQIGLLVGRLNGDVLNRAPFWMLLTAMAGGQLLFNRELGSRWRVFLLASLGAVLVFALYWNREAASTWMGIAAVVGILGWLRWPRLRWPVIILIVLLACTGILSSAVYDFAGGADEWETSGGSRLALIGRVVEVTLRNPITGLGPAAYRAYGAMKPLTYGLAIWIQPQISSHNNYVDLFSHVGILGLGLFLWFAAEVAMLGVRLRQTFTHGFAAAYVNSMLAAGVGSLTLMLFADWILPFVYNIGFSGFQTSVLVWLFMGGLLVYEQLGRQRNTHTSGQGSLE